MNARMCVLPFALALVGWIAPLEAQTQTGAITGTVKDKTTGQPLPGVQVSVVGTRLGQITNEAGRFLILQVPAGNRQVSAVFIGYAEGEQTVTVTAGATATVELTIEQTVLPLQEIVVSGVTDPTAGVKLPFTVSRVSTEQLQVPTTQTALASLQGKVAGASIIPVSGKPGAGMNILLRSPTGFESSNSPLILLDGVVISRELDGTTGDIESLEIENIEVIKGAAAASLYGSRAAAGVVSITTSRGRNLAQNQTRVTSRTEIGSNFLADAVPLTNAHHYQMNETGTGFVNSAGQDTTWSGRVVKANRIMDNPYPGRTYDNIRALYNPGVFLKQNLSLSHNAENTTFLLSFTREDNEGALEGNDGFWRNLARVSIDHRIGQKLSFALTGQHSRTWDDVLSGDPNEAIAQYPTFVDLTRRDSNGEYPMLPDSSVLVENPLWRQRTRDHYDSRARTMGSISARYAMLDWLSLDAQFSYDRADTKFQEYVPKGIPLSVETDQPALGSLQLEHRENNTMNGHFGAAVTRRFGDVNARVTARGTFEKENTEFFEGGGEDFLVRGVRDLSAIRNITILNSSTVDIRSNGYLADLALDVKDRYIASFLVRRDGSSLFGPLERWQTYKRASTKYRISEEPWFNLPYIDELGIRYAMGEAGGRPDYSWQYELWGVNRASGLSRETAGNAALKPQFTREQEVGIDLIAFNNRMSLELVYAHQMTRDQMIVVPATVITGFSSVRANAAVMKGRSYEATLQAYPIRRQNLTWSVNAVADNSVTRITDWNRSCFWGSNAGREHEFTCAGERAGDFWVQNTVESRDELPVWLQDRADEFQINDEGYLVWVGSGNSWRDGNAKNLWGTSFQANGFTYRWGEPFRQVDDEGNVVRVRGGSSLPDVNFGFGSNLRYKNFSLYAQLRGQIGGKVYNRARHWLYGVAQHGDLDQSGKPDELKKPVDYYERGLAANSECNGSGSACTVYIDEFLEDGTHLKLGELSARYRFGRDQIRKVLGNMAPAEIAMGVNGRNLFILSGYSGLDPERGSPLSRVEYLNYPLLRLWTATIDITF